MLWDGQEGHRPFTIEPGRLQREPARVRHGYGYTAFSTTAYGLNCEAVTFIDPTAPVKYTLLTLENPGEQERRLQLLYQAEWALGERGDPASIYAYTYGEAAFAEACGRLRKRPGTLPVPPCRYRYATTGKLCSRAAGGRKPCRKPPGITAGP